MGATATRDADGDAYGIVDGGRECGGGEGGVLGGKGNLLRGLISGTELI